MQSMLAERVTAVSPVALNTLQNFTPPGETPVPPLAAFEADARPTVPSALCNLTSDFFLS